MTWYFSVINIEPKVAIISAIEILKASGIFKFKKDFETVLRFKYSVLSVMYHTPVNLLPVISSLGLEKINVWMS
jgi:hypothetical protein